MISVVGCTVTDRPDASPTGPTTTSAGEVGSIKVTRLAAFGEMLTSSVAAPDGGELLVATRVGRVYRVGLSQRDGVPTAELDPNAILDLSGEVTTEFDRGFLNMVLVDGGRSLVVMYTGVDGALVLGQYPYTPGVGLDAGGRRDLFVFPFPFPFHHGGGLAVDGAGNLLVGLGDEGLSLPGLPGPQDPTLMMGGVMSIPADVLGRPTEPWSPTPDLMIVRGLRNPWRLSVDDDGGLWIGDVGNLLVEEIDHVDAADLAATVPNFGHPYYEGSVVKSVHIPDVPFLPAALEREHEAGICGVVGGSVYRGTSLGSLAGRFVYSDLCQPEIRSLVLDDEGRATDDRADVELEEPLISFGEGASGEVFLLGSAGGLYRLDPASSRAVDNDQRLFAVEPPMTIPAHDKVYCGIMEAIEPFDYLGGVSPEALRDAMATSKAQLTERVPAVPEDAREDAAVVLRVFFELDEALAAVGWDTESPSLAGLRSDLLAASGIFEGFPEALSALFDSSCA